MYCSRENRSPLISGCERKGDLIAHVQSAYSSSKHTVLQQSPVGQFITVLQGGLMFCERAQPGRSCSPHSQRTFRGAGTAEITFRRQGIWNCLQFVA